MKVLFFGRFGDVAGASRTIDAAGLKTVADVTARLCEDPAIEAMLEGATVVTVLDDRIVKGDAIIEAARELAYLPPVSGG